MLKTLLLAVGLVAATTVAATAAPAWTTGSVNFRDGPGTHYSKLGTLYSCTRVETDRAENGWYRVNWNGRWGWVSGRYLSWNNNCAGTYRAPQTYSAPSRGGY